MTRQEMAIAAAVRDAACEFGRRLGDEDLRRFLRKAGWSGGDVIVTVREEPAEAALYRLFTTTMPPVLIALRRPSGFVFRTLRPTRRWRRKRPLTLMVAPETTMGMLYDDVRRDAVSAPRPTPWFTIRALIG
ncbi:MAG: hypothetical protein HOU81_24290 [Hamadaea sp.]|uniref:hypothetical protein n=1 Tax=Hamadaea sp. TaxID=2024425 RepID=UPI00184E5992|nr:hypothetical protein [Hamadaea sp.]NUR73946.1 hypothetical protein [Hamadaea sp.]NUT21904.1 hypothetical protein [Hamadaea sp.]